MLESPSRLAGTGLCCLLLFMGNAGAQQMEPRAYSNAPVGMNFLVAGYAYSTGGYSADPSLPLTNAHLTLQTPAAAYAHVLDIGGRSGKFDAIVVGGCVSGSAEFNGAPVSRDVCGLLDPAFRLSVNLYGAPALRLKEFGAYHQDVIVGASLQVQAPWGQYDPSRLVNLGNNRWAFRPEIGISKSFDPVTVELAAGAALFTNNGNFYGGKTREQDPVYTGQVHLIYQFRGGAWASLNGTYFTGGRTTVNGIENNDKLGNSRGGLTLALPVNRFDSVKLHASKGISTRTGADFQLLSVFWQHRWGGGL